MWHFHTPLAQVGFSGHVTSHPPWDHHITGKRKESTRVRRLGSRPASILPRWMTFCSLLGLSVPVSSYKVRTAIITCTMKSFRGLNELLHVPSHHHVGMQEAIPVCCFRLQTFAQAVPSAYYPLLSSLLSPATSYSPMIQLKSHFLTSLTRSGPCCYSPSSLCFSFHHPQHTRCQHFFNSLSS